MLLYYKMQLHTKQIPFKNRFLHASDIAYLLYLVLYSQINNYNNSSKRIDQLVLLRFFL